MYYFSDNSVWGGCTVLLIKNVNYDKFFDKHICNLGDEIRQS